MKLKILFEFKDGASGGGNNFLKALKDYFKKENLYTESSEEADCFLFNSHHFIDDVVSMKRKYPNKIFIHRIDGPMTIYNTLDDPRDFVVNLANRYLADSTIFQSEFSKSKNYQMGYTPNSREKVIYNAADQSIFSYTKKNLIDNKIKIIATSWSSNINKGFNVYKFLDENLDHNKFEFTFIGNSPFKFKNIITLKPMNHDLLSKQLHSSHIYITASQNDPCSNSLIEAASVGLPILALNSGGHPELLDGKGLVFNSNEDLMDKIDLIVSNYNQYSGEYPLNMKKAYGEYKEFIFTTSSTKKFSTLQFIGFKCNSYLKKLSQAISQRLR